MPEVGSPRRKQAAAARALLAPMRHLVREDVGDDTDADRGWTARITQFTLPRSGGGGTKAPISDEADGADDQDGQVLPQDPSLSTRPSPRAGGAATLG